jgi:hypothetical protein
MIFRKGLKNEAALKRRRRFMFFAFVTAMFTAYVALAKSILEQRTLILL